MDNILALRNLNISVPNNENILLDSFKINVGDVIQIKAPSGRGKSFFYHTLLGMTDASQMLFKDETHLAKLFCYCPAYLPFFCETVSDELKRLQFNTNEIQSLISAGLIDQKFLHIKCRDLSNGQNQLLILLRAVLSNRPVVILDELMNSMDLELKLKVTNYFQETFLKSRAIIYSLHQSLSIPLTRKISI